MSDTPRPTLPLPAPPPLTIPPDFVGRLGDLGVTLDQTTLDRIADYLARLRAMNELVNLTSITEPEEMWTRHALDALSLLPQIAALKVGARVLDVGSGGGVPGIILAIARPELRVTLLEATEKKARFLEAVGRALELTKLTVLTGRAERLTNSELAHSFDTVTARAVGKIAVVVPWTAPFVRHGGRLLLVKGAQADEEILAAKSALQRFRCSHIHTELTPTGRIVVFKVRTKG